MKIILLLFSCLLFIQAMAQDETIKNLQSESSRTVTKDDKDTTIKTWKTGGTFNFNLSQGSLSNWQPAVIIILYH